MTLIIVESPTKAKKIAQILGAGYTVRASLGHIKDLPPDKFAVNIPAIEGKSQEFPLLFAPTEGKTKLIRDLRQIAQGKDCLLAADPDREGEAIAWHLKTELQRAAQSIRRIQFHAITESDIKHAIANKTDVDMHQVQAQWSRRAIDRITGYLISPKLQDALSMRGLSAGRVQSTVLAEIVKREREILNFQAKPFWTIRVILEKDASKFKATSDRYFDKTQAEKHFRVASSLQVLSTKQADKTENPRPPFTASVLQQEANKLWKWSPDKTMRAAQSLFENGYISYHRTDSPKLEPETIQSIRSLIPAQYLPAQPFQYKAKSAAQGAHEAIRPAHLSRDYAPSRAHIDDADMARLYDVIWKRAFASQMKPALWFTHEIVLVDSLQGKYTAKARTLRFPGWRDIYQPHEDDQEDAPPTLPALTQGETLNGAPELKEDKTKPPGRYSEGAIVKWMEQTGVGRPSTYANAVKTLKTRDYTTLTKAKLIPTETGFKVTDYLLKEYPWICQAEMTAHMEEQLDQVETKTLNWKTPVVQVIDKLRPLLEYAETREAKDWKPSDKQTAFARKLHTETGIELPDSVLTSGRNLSAWIDTAAKKQKTARKKQLDAQAPSDKQIDYAKKLSEWTKTELPDDILKSKLKLSKWIDKAKKPKKKRK